MCVCASVVCDKEEGRRRETLHCLVERKRHGERHKKSESQTDQQPKRQKARTVCDLSL